MKVKQIADLMNTITSEIMGTENIVAEDLSNIVDVGNQIFDNTSVDNYVKKLIDHIGKVQIVDRLYRGGAPKVFRDSWEYGAVMEKISFQVPEAQKNSSWDLVNGQSYDPNVFTAPQVVVKFFEQRETFEIPMSITEKQVKGSFSNAYQMNAFISGLWTAIKNSITMKFDALIMRTINNMTAEVLHHNYPEGNYTASSFATAVNVLHDYNAEYGTKLTADNCIHDAGFLRYFAKVQRKYMDWLKVASTKYNVGGQPRFTPDDFLHVVMLTDVAVNSEYDMQSDVYHNDLVKLPYYEQVPYWQAPGEGAPSFAKNSEIHVTTASDQSSVEASGILSVMFDHDALGVTNHREYNTQQYNARAEFTNSWSKVEAGAFNDLNENFVVFFVA